MYRSALIVMICAGSSAAQTVFCRTPHVPAFCDQAIVSYWGNNEGVSPPVALMQCGNPAYTEEARLGHLAGFVTMSLTVDDEGMPSQIHVLRPLGLGLDESAAACMRQSRYSPAQKDGKPVPLSMSVSLPFDQHWNSDWHLGSAVFQTTTGCARPVLVKAQYPDSTGDHRSVTVLVHLTIAKDGAPRDLKVASTQDRKLDKEAMAILAAWRFKPGTQNHQPIDVPATLTLVHGGAARVLVSSHRLK